MTVNMAVNMAVNVIWEHTTFLKWIKKQINPISFPYKIMVTGWSVDVKSSAGITSLRWFFDFHIRLW